MVYDRYYYTILSAENKQIYKTIYDGIMKHKADIFVPNCAYNNQISQIIQAINFDNPHLYYVDFEKVQIISSSTTVCFNFTYWYNKKEVKEIESKVLSITKKMLAKCSAKTDLEKEKYVHDLLTHNVIYNHEAANNLSKYYPRSNTMLGPYFYKTAVCEGIAKATKFLLNILNVKCIVAVGKVIDGASDDNHAWNIVKIDGKVYHLDVTSDLNCTPNGPGYMFFNISEKEYLKMLNISPFYKYPTSDVSAPINNVPKQTTINTNPNSDAISNNILPKQHAPISSSNQKSILPVWFKNFRSQIIHWFKK